jgi:formamidopyrimidine-DNA glycosylase
VGRRIKEVDVRPVRNAMKVVRRHGRRKELQDLLTGAKVEKIGRLGKRLLFELDNGHTLVFDLGPSGALLKTSSSDGIEPHTYVVLAWTIGGQLRFVDPRTAGEVFVVPTEELEKDEFRPAGLDPLDNAQPLTWQQFSTLLEQRGKRLKDLLLDDGFVLGLGDVYSDEVLWSAALRWDRDAGSLSSQDVRRLYRALVETLQEAVKARGASWGDDAFRDLHGQRGAFQEEIRVYGREGEACRRCRNTVERAEFRKGRFTYFCPQCQA